MKHTLFAVALACASAAGPLAAQQSGAPVPMPAAGGMDHSAMNHAAMMGGATVSTMPTEPGQGAFAAIGEIVALLEADSQTDWSAIDIDALRAHLVDMDMVVTWARVTREAIDFGERYVISGEGQVVGSIRRMVTAHAGVMEGKDGWSYMAAPTETGAVLEVTVPESDMSRLHALGFFGILASGMHHQSHHWMMAAGSNPHQ